MPIDSPLGRISPDWPLLPVFNVLPKTPITVRTYLPAELEGRRVHVRLIHNTIEKERTDLITLPPPPIVAPVEIPMIRTPTIDTRIKAHEPTYPTENWEFLWFGYSRDNTNPWEDFIERTVKYEINFDDNWYEKEVGTTGQSDLVGFIASRTIRLFDSGLRRFVIGGDDGIRLTLYNNEFDVIFQETRGWRDQPYTTYTHDQDLPEGAYKIFLEWYENTGAARASFSISTIRMG